MSMNPDVIRKTADRIEQEQPASEFKDQITNLDVAAWAKESAAAAREKAYLNGTIPHATRDQAQANPDSVPALPAGYEKNALAVADQRIALAGYRLAAVLEQIAKEL
jgi:hypothetical protein